MFLYSRVILPSTRLTSISRQGLCRPFNTTSHLFRHAKKRRYPPRRFQREEQVERQFEQQDRRAGQEERQFEQLLEEENARYSSRYQAGKVIVYTIIASCTGVLVYENFLKASLKTNPTSSIRAAAQAYQKHFVMSWKGIREGRYHTMFTSAFAHTGLLHLGFNMYCLYGFAPMAVGIMGPGKFAVLYVGSLASGALAQYLWWDRTKDYEARAVGASGALCGFVGALACRMPFMPVQVFMVPMTMWMSEVLLIGVSIGGLQGWWLQGIGHMDHLGGLAFGAVFWLVALRRTPAKMLNQLRR